MNEVEGFGLLLQPPAFDREFGPQQTAPGEDFLGGKRKLHFEPPCGQPYGAPPKRRSGRESDKARGQKPKREDQCLFNHIRRAPSGQKDSIDPFTTNLSAPQILHRTGNDSRLVLGGNDGHARD
jgi:hypothetical protein